MIYRPPIVALLWVVILTLPFLSSNRALGAQSTADAVADDALKKKLRQEVVGTVEFPGEKQEYIIGYGDVLSVTVYGEGDMAASAAVSGRAGGQEAEGGGDAPRNTGAGVEVRLDGRVSLLHVGDVHVVGMTLTQLADYLKKLYATVYADPIITTVLVQSNSRRYTVMGQVLNPGIFYLDYPITIVQTIARSGGFTEWANQEVTVVRAGDGLKSRGKQSEKIIIQFDYGDLVKGKKLENNVYIQSGDVIVVH